jgi:DNA-binding beta-propeller fold protein YncE
MPNRQSFLLSVCVAASVFTALNLTLARAAPFMIVGNDEKVAFDGDGKAILSPPGKDSVVILDVADPENPKIVANLPLKNSVIGPPVNVAIDPTNSIALVADSVDVAKDGDALKIVPDNKVYVIDLKANPPKLDLPTGQWPYNVAVAPDGKIALTADNGNAGSSDGSVDTVSVIDLEAKPPRIIDRVVVGNDVVGDGPEGIAVSPKGDVAVAGILAGSNMKNTYFYHPNGAIAVLRVDGKKVTPVGYVEVGGLPEGLAFTPDGKYLLVGNYIDQDISILKVDGTTVTNTGKRFKLPGHPASVRMSTQ